MADFFRILVVDDEPAQLELVEGFLKKRGFETALAESGEKALRQFREAPFDLVLTDQRMPDMSGLDLLKALRAIHPEASVIVMTAFGTIETAVSAIKAGAADYLTKPLNLDELLYRIEQVKERLRLLRHARPDLVEDLQLELPETLLRPQHFRLVLLQLRRDEPLASHQSLAPHIVGRNIGEVRL